MSTIRVLTAIAILVACMPPPAWAQKKAGDEPSTAKDAAPPPADPSPSAPPEVAAAGEVARQVEEARTALKFAHERLMTHFADVEPLEKLDLMGETEKLKALLAFVAELIRTGEQALADEAAFRDAFNRYVGLAVKATESYREAALHYREKAEKAEFEDVRDTYREIAAWYEARSRRHAAEVGLVLPSDIETERRHVEGMLGVARDFRSTLQVDPLLLAKDRALDLRAFKSFYPKLGDALRSWREQLRGGVQDAAPGQQGAGEGEGPSTRPAWLPEAGGPRVRYATFVAGLTGRVGPGSSKPRRATPHEPRIQLVSLTQEPDAVPLASVGPGAATGDRASLGWWAWAAFAIPPALLVAGCLLRLRKARRPDRGPVQTIRRPRPLIRYEVDDKPVEDDEFALFGTLDTPQPAAPTPPARPRAPRPDAQYAMPV